MLANKGLTWRDACKVPGLEWQRVVGLGLVSAVISRSQVLCLRSCVVHVRVNGVGEYLECDEYHIIRVGA